ncbi:TPM domain-containing protein [Ponticoccus sp. SC2-23]|uniref:TPM domain-containing protein n=1 Tax=Alexandriicola marinus TaxID=2081710 RepID=UPI000FD9B825|nr:TPM domain-containing protein [Alexandriicola marinus]MBM1222297.1 TPM domain-containing protein [Ponticoccus sp. SC6-9]MBM1224410.1 TPM domain-containing protein [Ponticoccus sp. SC6-15]MBM1229810.1 TPM domain-containing protein [Ponticoccus sp. SC6-38]MBM1233376.1 TPM domain-containing protein [Ponticoccus sp. SC6-45]MBM1236674.1 TPM domain-containing protein [Ponticoccus sp. SC6-49]MBM1244718.1 TPM domain-containing protein [Ponticoccus sp. SC2-64]MBM1246900.1 TPM domain-containing pro
MTIKSLILASAFALAGNCAFSQSYPTQSETPVTDDAEVLDPVDEARLAERVVALEQETRTDIAVVTLPSTALYTMGDDIDVYAQGLIEEWNLGDTTGGRSVMLLVFRDDRELRLEVTGDFPVDIETVAPEIVQDTILPAFREDDFGAGISMGIDAVATRILTAEVASTPTNAPAAETGEGGGSNILIWIGGVVAALVGLGVVSSRRAKAKLAATPCAACGKTGLTKENVVTREPTETTEGRGETRLTCPSCGHVAASPYTISKKTPAAKKSSDDKKPKSGGASGEW